MAAKKLMRPAIALLDRIRISRKFGLIFLIVMTPLIVLSTIMVRGMNTEINFLDKERQGLSYIETIREPIEYIQQHRGLMAAILSGDQGLRNQAREISRRVDQAFTNLEKLDQKLGSELETKQKLSSIQSKWEKIKADLRRLTIKQSFKRHTQLVKDLTGLASHVAESSNITLDPHLDSFYLGDAVVSRLFNLTEAMGQSRAVGSAAAAAKELDKQQHIRLAVLTAQMQNNNDSLTQGLESAFAENPDLARNLETFARDNSRAVQSLSKILHNDLLDTQTITVEAETVFDAATKAINETYRLYDAITPELDRLFIQRIEQNTWIRNMVLAVVVITLTIVVYLFAGLYISMSSSIISIAGLADQLSQGDITANIEVTQRHEMGRLQSAMKNMAGQLHGIISELSQGVQTLASSSTELNTISDDMTKRSETTASKTHAVSAAAEEMSSNMNSVASAMEQAANNVNTVASSSEEMSTTLSEIAQNTEKARQVTSNAVQKSKQSSKRMDQLGNAAEEISKVTETITSISSQTNLLALNATIEAARAGEAGKGFAVVANEIKELAQQTAQATEEIKEKINGIQDATKLTIDEIHEISQIIENIDSIIQNIAASVEEQSTATRDIAENVSQASTGIQEINENVSQTSTVAGDVAGDIAGVNTDAEEMSNSSIQVRQSANELSQLAEKLKEIVSRFKV